MRAEREELDQQIADWIEERRAIGQIPLPDSRPEAELLRLLRAAESAATASLTDAEAWAVLASVRSRALDRSLRAHPTPRRSFPRLSLALAAAALMVLCLALWPRTQEAPMPQLEVVKRIRFELVDAGRVVALELTAYGPQPPTQEASNDTTHSPR